MFKESHWIRDLLLGVVVIVVGAGVVALANLPSRVSVLESQYRGIDHKLDEVLARLDK